MPFLDTSKPKYKSQSSMAGFSELYVGTFFCFLEMVTSSLTNIQHSHSFFLVSGLGSSPFWAFRRRWLERLCLKMIMKEITGYHDCFNPCSWRRVWATTLASDGFLKIFFFFFFFLLWNIKIAHCSTEMNYKAMEKMQKVNSSKGEMNQHSF